MGERGRVSGRLQLKQQLVLVAVLVGAVAATGWGRLDGPEGMSIPLKSQESEIRLVANSIPAPLVPTPLEPSLATTLEPEPARTVGAATMPIAIPVRLQIPSIGVDSELMDLGLQPDGTLEVPPSGFPAGWYTGAPTPGELGPAIIAGHVSWAGQPGVFFHLQDLSTGDEIAITREDGSTARFRVTRVERFAKDQFPTQAVYGDLDHAGLRLITCGGEFDRQLRSYRDNVVVFAEFVGSHLPGGCCYR